MSNDIDNRNESQVTEPFVWRTRHGEAVAISDMTTKHLFFTFRMVWNHSAPEAWRLRPYRRYIFGPAYTPEYVAEAVGLIWRELATRNDLDGWQINQLETIANYCQGKSAPYLKELARSQVKKLGGNVDEKI